jgi:hypothetical protein
MGVVKNPGSENSAIFSNDFPFICIMLPSGIFMEDGHTEVVGIFTIFVYVNLYYICFPGKGSSIVKEHA